MNATATSPADSDHTDIEPDRFRRIMGSLVSGVSVICSIDDTANPCGLTCSALCSVSATPPLLLFCVQRPSRTLDAITNSGAFSVNFLDADATNISSAFVAKTHAKFTGIDWRPSNLTGMPIIDAALAYADCQVHDRIDAGDHVIVLGRVIDGDADDRRFPLGYWRRHYIRIFRMTDHTTTSAITAAPETTACRQTNATTTSRPCDRIATPTTPTETE